MDKPSLPKRFDELTERDIARAVERLAREIGSRCEISREDGYTWLTLTGPASGRRDADLIGQRIADETGRDFYLRRCERDALEGPLDARFEIPYYPSDELIPPFSSAQGSHRDPLSEAMGERFVSAHRRALAAKPPKP